MNYLNMDELPAFQKLSRLAARPFDLTAGGTFHPRRFQSLQCRAGSFTLYYAAQRLDDPVLDTLQELADQAGLTDQFIAMKKGRVMNRIEGFESENRAVLHTAMRDLFSEKPAHPGATAMAHRELTELESFLAELDSGQLVNGRGETFTDLINIGIGGSDLGPRAVYLALRPFCREGRRVHFISNVDPDDAALVIEGLDLSRTLVNVVSKSGTTLETLTNEALVKEAFRRQGLEPGSHFLAVTGEGSPMDNPRHYRRSFHMFDSIGGRYSVSSMVGGVMLGFAMGPDNFKAFLRGANRIDRGAETRDIRKNLPLLLALIGVWNRNFLDMDTLAILPYSQALIRFVAHLQQCDMESNGKSINRRGEPLAYQTGPIVWGEPGTNGQHAFYQLLHQGTTPVPVEFIGFKSSQYGQDLIIHDSSSQQKLLANLLAQSQALAVGQQDPNPNKYFSGNRPSSLLLGNRLTPESMGELLATYENKIAFQGFLWNINSFDQEGVQLGKGLANRLLGHFAERNRDQRYNGGTDDPVGWMLLGELGLLGK